MGLSCERGCTEQGQRFKSFLAKLASSACAGFGCGRRLRSSECAGARRGGRSTIWHAESGACAGPGAPPLPTETDSQTWLHIYLRFLAGVFWGMSKHGACRLICNV